MTKRTKNIRLLCTEEDRAALEPVLSALAEKGIRKLIENPGPAAQSFVHLRAAQ